MQRKSLSTALPLAMTAACCCLVLLACTPDQPSGSAAGMPPTPPAAVSHATTTPTAQAAPAGPLSPVAVLAVTTPLGGGVSGEVVHPADWQPGTNVLTYCSGAEIRAIAPPGYVPTTIATLPGGTTRELLWSPDGSAALVLANEESDTGLTGDTIHLIVPSGAGYGWIPVPSFPFYRGKGLGLWLDASTAAFRVWLGGGAQHLYAVDAQTGRRWLLFDTQRHVERAAIGGRYYPSPSGRYVAVQDCCFVHIFVAATESPDTRDWITDPSQGP